MEEWKEIPGFPGYFISSFGRVKTHRGLRKIPTNKDGYPVITLTKPGIRKTFRISRLVCAAFHGPPPFEGALVLHFPDDTRTNCHKDNLKWGTQKGNMSTRDYAKGEDHHSSKLSSAEVEEIRRLHAEGEPQHSLARRFRVTVPTIHNIVHNRIWR